MRHIVAGALLLGALVSAASYAAVVETELAGQPLQAYPYFEYVRAFNGNTRVAIGIDPSRFPQIAGVTADLYVVAARGSWSLGTPLLDESAVVETVTFPGGSLAANRFRLAAGGELDSDAGVDIGVPYDVVVDVDRDGALSDGDFIDHGGAGEAGMYAMKDLVEPGPLAVTDIDYAVTGVTPGFSREKTWYPANIDQAGRLPLVVIGHGNGHNYTWYDYLQEHLASHGYIVMSHQNNTGPGPTSASTTTLEHTDAIIEQQGEIAGGVLDGHIDSSRIVWIGHSRGAEGVAIAYNRIVTGDWDPEFYDREDVVVVSSIAPTDFGSILADPHGVNYHLLYGSADGDVHGGASLTCCWPFALLERAKGFRASTYVHGADHNDFNCCGFDDFSGPPGTAIGREEAQRLAKGDYLALVKHFVEGNIPAKDYLWRQYERFRPAGVAATTIAVKEYNESPLTGKLVIDDYQSNPSPTRSSSGGPVIVRVDDLEEGLLRDPDATFTWRESDPFNGMTRSRETGETRGAVFSFDGDRPAALIWGVPAGDRDVSGFKYLSFRACQGTRHPFTIERLEDLTWIVGLRDGDGDVGAIEFSAYGGGIEEPYQRTGEGVGAGWANEFESIRIRLTDFTTGNPDLDLDDITAIAMGFVEDGIAGRVGLDDLEFTFD